MPALALVTRVARHSSQAALDNCTRSMGGMTLLRLHSSPFGLTSRSTTHAALPRCLHFRPACLTISHFLCCSEGTHAQ